MASLNSCGVLNSRCRHWSSSFNVCDVGYTYDGRSNSLSSQFRLVYGDLAGTLSVQDE